MTVSRLSLAGSLCCLLPLASADFASVQKNSSKPTRESKPKTSVTNPKTLAPGQLAFDEAMGHVKQLASKFEQYRNAAKAGESLATLASVVCKYDKAQASVFYLRATDLVKAALGSEERLQVRDRLRYTRYRMISLAAQCDAALAEGMGHRLKTEDEDKADAAGSWPNLKTAHLALQSDPKKFAQFSQESSSRFPDLSSLQMLGFVGELQELGKEAPEAADGMFFQALEKVRQTPSPLRAVTALGNYVFGPVVAYLPPGFERFRDSVTGHLPFDDDANDARAYRFEVQRTAASPSTVNAYLQTASDVLSRISPRSSAEAGVAYATAQQLLQRSNEIAPGVAPDYETTFHRLSESTTDPALKSKITRTLSMTPSDSFKLDEEELEKAAEHRQRDELRLKLFTWHWLAPETAKAEALAAAVEDKGLRSQLLSLVAFRRVQLALGRSDIAQAQVAFDSLGSPVLRALALLGMAGQHLQLKDSALANTVLNHALREIAKTDREHRQYLLVAASILAASTDQQVGLRVLEDSINVFNQLDAGGAADKEKGKEQEGVPEISASTFGFVELARFGKMQRHFDLQLKGLTFKLPDAVEALKFSPPEHLSAALFGLLSEDHQGPALAAAAAAFLERTRARQSTN